MDSGLCFKFNAWLEKSSRFQRILPLAFSRPPKERATRTRLTCLLPPRASPAPRCSSSSPAQCWTSSLLTSSHGS